MSEVNNSRIAKNAVMLYVRMLVTMVVTLYTSRVVLKVLGVEDFGIYSVVGGVVAMFNFLNASMSGATSRFLTFELGRGDREQLKRTFTTALLVHFGITVVAVLLAETVGLWLLMQKLVIAPERMAAAHWVYQMSILTMAVKVTQVPYNASIIAHERMNVYAWVEIVNVVLQLLIVYLLELPGAGADKLILYAVLAFSVSLLVALVYRVYCVRQFQECRFSRRLHADILRPMLTFSGWDLYGNMSVAVRQQGINILQNMFFGARVNAAAGITTQVSGALTAFAYNVITAFRPQIIKKYAERDFASMQLLMSRALKLTLALFLMMAIPLIIEMPVVLNKWLGGNVPPYTVQFSRLVLAATAVGLVNTVLVIAIHATGRIKLLSFITGTWFLVSLLPVWVMYRLGWEAAWSYWMMIACNVVVVVTDVLILRRLVPQLRLWSMLAPIAVGNMALVACAAVAGWAVHAAIDAGWLRLVAVTATSCAVYAPLFWLVMLSRHERQVLVGKIRARLGR